MARHLALAVILRFNTHRRETAFSALCETFCAGEDPEHNIRPLASKHPLLATPPDPIQ
jgi:hypothetical protein